MLKLVKNNRRIAKTIRFNPQRSIRIIAKRLIYSKKNQENQPETTDHHFLLVATLHS